MFIKVRRIRKILWASLAIIFTQNVTKISVFTTLFKSIAKNFATALNTANDSVDFPQERSRRFWKSAFNKAKEEARRVAEAAARAQEHARRVAEAAHRRAQEHARRVAEAARRRAQEHARRVAEAAARAREHARRVAEAARRKAQEQARRLAATARAFVNTIKNKFGGLNGVLKAFRIGFQHFKTLMRQLW